VLAAGQQPGDPQPGRIAEQPEGVDGRADLLVVRRTGMFGGGRVASS
jgi:hypothetical protein